MLFIVIILFAFNSTVFATASEKISHSNYYSRLEHSKSFFLGRPQSQPIVIKSGAVNPSLLLKNLWSHSFEHPIKNNIANYLKSSPILKNGSKELNLRFLKTSQTNRGQFIKYQQIINGIDVFNSVMTVGLDNENRLKSISSEFKDLSPNILPENAAAKDLAHLTAVDHFIDKFNQKNEDFAEDYLITENDIKIANSRLVYYPTGNTAILTYMLHVNVPSDDLVYKCLIDAENLSIILIRKAIIH